MNNTLTSKKESFLLIIFVTSLLVFIVCANYPIDPDMWWHLRNGQLVATRGSIPKVDQFSFTKLNQPWVNAFWLSDLIIYIFYKLGGLTLLVIIFAILGVITYISIFKFISGNFLLKAILVILAAISTSPEWTIRPQVISFLILSSLNIYIIHNNNLNWKKYSWLPFLFLVWANIHGGYIWGVLLLIAVIIGNYVEIFVFKNKTINKLELNKFSLLSLISFLFITINPNGLDILKLPFQTINVSISSIMEWASPNFHDMIMQPFLWIVLLFITSSSLSKRRLPIDQLLKVIGFLFLAFISQRNIPLAIVVLLPIMIDNLSSLFNNNQNNVSKKKSNLPRFVTYSLNTIIILCLGFACAIRIYSITSSSKISDIYPTQAVNWIHENHPKGNMLNSYNWGGYLIFNLPEYKVFIDGRADLYGNELIGTWWDIVSDKPDAMPIIDKYGVNFVLLEPDRPIIKTLLDNNWKISYQDEISVIVSR